MNALSSTVQIAFDALRANLFRSILTMLGIIIGVGAVISTVSVGRGATARIQDQIAGMGSNLIIVTSGSITTSGMRLGSGNALTLTLDDARAIAAECPAVLITAPTSRGGAQVIAGNSNWATQIQGTTPDHLTVRNLAIASGRAFTTQEVEAAQKVVLLGPTVASNLFPSGDDPVGQIIRIRSVPFTVIGVLEAKGQSPTGQDQDDVMIMPITTAKRKVLGSSQAAADSVGAILVQAREGGAGITEALSEIQGLLRQRHRLSPGQEDDFTARNLEEVFAAQEDSSRVMAILLAAIASVSLLVGGIGIMNIMMVSVTERTREIGIRKAIGARTTDILAQFLVEAVTLSVLGGLAGIAAGVAGSELISRIAGWATLVSPGSILLAALVSGLIGVFFGFYPARRAARLDPIVCLRYE